MNNESSAGIFRWLMASNFRIYTSSFGMEAFLVSAIVILVLRFIPNKFSTARYITASLGLMTIVLLSIVTFIYLLGSSESSTTTNTIVQAKALRMMPQTTLTPVGTYLDRCKRFHPRLPALVSNGMDFRNIAFFPAHTDRVSLCGKTQARIELYYKTTGAIVFSKSPEQLNINRLISLAESSAIQGTSHNWTS